MGATGGFGVTFGIGSTVLSGTPTYTTIAQVRSWNGLELEAVMAEWTHTGSSGGWQQFVPSGKKNSAELELGLAWDKTQATQINSSGGLLHAFVNGTPLAYKITLPDGANWVFDAYVSKFKHDSQQDSHIEAIVTLRPTGAPTYATGA